MKKESLLHYQFSNSHWLQEALTHKSYAHDHGLPYDNQRLEFLGDAVLDLVVSRELFDHAMLSEGELTQLRAEIVCGRSLLEVSQQLDLASHLRLGQTHQKAPDSALEDAVEALIGAVYLDGGLQAAKGFISELGLLEKKVKRDDPKSELLEYYQQHGNPKVEFRLISRSGPDHDPKFLVGIWVDNIKMSEAEASSKKLAQQRAAGKILERL